MTDMMDFHIEVLKDLNLAHDPEGEYLDAPTRKRAKDELEQAEEKSWEAAVASAQEELRTMQEPKKMQVSDLVKQLDENAKAELRQEQLDVVQVKLKIKRRELAQAQKVCSNIEREIEDMKHELTIDLARS